MTTFYTGKGDAGDTGLLGPSRVGKDSQLVSAIGDVDELNSAIGVAITMVADEHTARALRAIQNDLFTIGADLAGTGSARALKTITRESTSGLEAQIAEIDATLPKLTKFVLPGGSDGGAALHFSRAICRRAERSVVACKREKPNPEIARYLNRLSSFLFAAALKLNRKEGVEESNPAY